jgi:hypothetical protein
MIKQILRMAKKDRLFYIKVAALLGYADVAPIKNWIRRKSVPKHMQERLQKFLKGELNVKISIE